jgi:hypothetical protein
VECTGPNEQDVNLAARLRLRAHLSLPDSMDGEPVDTAGLPLHGIGWCVLRHWPSATCVMQDTQGNAAEPRGGKK